MPGIRASSRASVALVLTALAGLAPLVAGCSAGSAATSRPREGSGASLMTALARVADTAATRSWIWYDDTALIATIAGTGSSPVFKKGFGALRGTGLGTSTLESAQAVKATGIDIYNEGYAITAGTLPKTMTLVHGGQNAQDVAAGMGSLGWQDHDGTLEAPPLIDDATSPLDVASARAPYRTILDQVQPSGADVRFGNSAIDLGEIGSPHGRTLAGDPLIGALAKCLGDVVAAEFNVHGSYFGGPVGHGPVETAIGVPRPASISAMPRAVACAAWASQSAARRYAGDVKAAVSTETMMTGKQRYATVLTNLAVTIVGGGQHIVRWQAGTPGDAGVVFGMMQLYELPALPSCVLARQAHAHPIGCGER